MKYQNICWRIIMFIIRKMHFTTLLMTFLCTALHSVVGNGSINYCGSRMCGNTDAHTFCQYPEGPSPSCVGYISAGLTNEEKSRVLARLNRRRNEAAAGRLPRLTGAGNMLKLRWVEELGREAQRWADQCQSPSTPEEQDVCRDLYSMPVGQCVASVVGEAPGLRVESMVDIWYMQNRVYKGNVTTYIPPSRDYEYYGDFAQMMWSQSYMVGCGRSRFMSTWQGRLRSVERLVCNIAPRGPVPGRPLWTPSAPATLCPSRSLQDSTFLALCDIQKHSAAIAEVDDTMSLEQHLLLQTVLDLEINPAENHPGSLDELYLTRLAVATMSDYISTTPYYNSIQRRDVIEMIDLGDSSTSSNSISVSTIRILPLIYDYKVKTNSNKRKSFIGRPKPYDMNELTDIDYRTENYSPIEDLSRRRKDFEAEYEFVDAIEEKVPTKPIRFNNATQSMMLVESSENLKLTTEVNPMESELLTTLYQNYTVAHSSIREETISLTILEEKNLSLPDNNIAESKKLEPYESVENQSLVSNDIVEDYLRDPETVRELQEALDQVEREMSTEITETTENETRQGKVRRELRDVSEESTDEHNVSDDSLNSELFKNQSIDKAPMYKMVLKYFPYLSKYQKSLTGKGVHMSSSFVLVLIFGATCIRTYVYMIDIV